MKVTYVCVCALCSQPFEAGVALAKICKAIECRRAYARQAWQRYASTRREMLREKARRYQSNLRHNRRLKHLRERYHITPSDFDALLRAQNGCCAICQTVDAGGRWNRVLHVDHDHKTGRIRGLLCDRCNRVLGRMGDDLEGVMHFVDYLGKREPADMGQPVSKANPVEEGLPR